MRVTICERVADEPRPAAACACSRYHLFKGEDAQQQAQSRPSMCAAGPEAQICARDTYFECLGFPCRTGPIAARHGGGSLGQSAMESGKIKANDRARQLPDGQLHQCRNVWREFSIHSQHSHSPTTEDRGHIATASFTRLRHVGPPAPKRALEAFKSAAIWRWFSPRSPYLVAQMREQSPPEHIAAGLAAISMKVLRPCQSFQQPCDFERHNRARVCRFFADHRVRRAADTLT